MPVPTSVLDAIKDADQRKSFENVLGANPDLQRYFETQNDIAARQKELDDQKRLWQASQDEYKRATATANDLAKKYQDALTVNPPPASSETDPLASLGDGNLTLEKLAEQLKAKGGFATAEDIKKEADKLRGEYAADQPRNTMAASTLASVAVSHQTEFGEPLDYDGLNKFMAANPRSFGNFKGAYDEYVREKRAQKTLDAKVAEAEKRAREDERAKVLAAHAGGIPGAPPPGFTPNGIMGNLEIKMNRPDDLKHLDGMSLMGTDKVNRKPVAQSAAAELRKEGKDVFVFTSEMGTISAGATR